MLKEPLMIRSSSFKMSDRLGEIVFPEGCRAASAPHSHNPTGRSTQVFPFSMGHRVCIRFAQERLRQPGQIGQRLRIHFSRHHAAGFHRCRIERQGILDLDTFRQQVSFQFPLHHGLPLLRRGSRRDPDQHDGKHQHEIRDTALVSHSTDTSIRHQPLHYGVKGSSDNRTVYSTRESRSCSVTLSSVIIFTTT